MRYIQALDTRDADLYVSVFTEDAEYDSVLNSSITLIDEDEATHRGYWQTLRKSDENIMIIGGMGIEEEQLVKQNGEWKIKRRTLTNFIQRRQ